jgi:hypothetical protein
MANDASPECVHSLNHPTRISDASRIAGDPTCLARSVSVGITRPVSLADPGHSCSKATSARRVNRCPLLCQSGLRFGDLLETWAVVTLREERDHQLDFLSRLLGLPQFRVEARLEREPGDRDREVGHASEEAANCRVARPRHGMARGEEE